MDIASILYAKKKFGGGGGGGSSDFSTAEVTIKLNAKPESPLMTIYAPFIYEDSEISFLGTGFDVDESMELTQSLNIVLYKGMANLYYLDAGGASYNIEIVGNYDDEDGFVTGDITINIVIS